MEENRHGRTVASGGENTGFDVRKAGDASVVLIGLPSVGKSTLLNSLTNANSEVASYHFTTLTAIPGMMECFGAKIQVLDLPGIVEGAAKGRGFGKRVLSGAINADLILLVLDVFQPKHVKILEKELGEVGIRTNQRSPEVLVEKTHAGGLSVQTQVPMKMSISLAKEILRIHGVHNGRLIIREPNLTDEQLIDVLSGNTLYLQSLKVINKIDLVDKRFIKDLVSTVGGDFVPISADKNMNIEFLKRAIYRKLDFIRIFLKPRGGEADYEEPLIMKRGCIISDVCDKIHRNFVKDFRYAYVWGKSVKFDGQKVGVDHKLADNDVLTIVKR